MNYQALKDARKSRNITQQQLASVLGVNRATISKYESGIIEPSISQLQTMASYIGISFSALAGEIVGQAYDAGFLDGSEAEKWENHVIDELWHDEGYTKSEIEIELITAFFNLNSDGQKEAVKRVEELTEIPKYQKTDK